MQINGELDPDVLRVLQASGYNGPHSMGPPRSELRARLQGLKDAGPAVTGTGAFQEPPGLQDGMHFALGQDRWQHGLAPDLERAAPEIYRNCRSEGVATMREWLQQRFSGDKSNANPEWVHLWMIATQVDFNVAKAPGGDVMALLSSDDNLEIWLRELSSYVHYQRTGDLNSATRMLAFSPPGTNTDIGPAWLVQQATAYATTEHNRNERVKAAKGKKA